MDIILFLIGTMAIFVFAMLLGARWAGRTFTNQLTTYLSAGESIVNHQRIPDAWLLPYRKRIASLRSAGKSEQEMERLGLAAQAHCLREFDKLIVFFERNNLTDGDETRDAVLASMRSQRDLCARSSWQVLLAPAPEPLPDDNK